MQEVTRLGFKGFCLQDSPLGVRLTDYASALYVAPDPSCFFYQPCHATSPAAINAAATFDKNLINQRGQAMGAEHRGKGVNVALGPMTNMGRVAAVSTHCSFHFLLRARGIDIALCREAGTGKAGAVTPIFLASQQPRL